MQNQDIIRSSGQLNPDRDNFLITDQIIQPLYESLLWIRLFAVCLIFYGALITVTGVGVLVAWLPMWIGMLLLMISRSIKIAYIQNDPSALMLTLSRFKTIFTILGLLSVALIAGSIYALYYAFTHSLF